MYFLFFKNYFLHYHIKTNQKHIKIILNNFFYFFLNILHHLAKHTAVES